VFLQQKPGGVTSPPVHGLLSDSAALSVWLVRRLGIVSRLRCVWRQWATPALRPHYLTEVGLGALLSRLPWRGAI